jgi:aspartyl protease family protein
MAMPVGAKRAASQAAGWLVAGCAAAFTFVYFPEITAAARSILGLPKYAAQQSAGKSSERVSSDRVARAAPALSGRTVELQAGAYGHYHVDAEINGRRIEVMVDTGATQVALTFEDASRAGVHVRDSDFTQLVRTANGVARVAPVTLDRVSIGDITVRNVPASVSERGMLATTLLGMSFLKRLSRVDMRGETLILQE